MVYHHPQDKYDSPPMDKYHQPLPLAVNASHGGPIDTTNDVTLHNDIHDGSRDGNRDGNRVMVPEDHDDNDDGSSVWRDAGGLYAHITVGEMWTKRGLELWHKRWKNNGASSVPYMQQH